MYADRWTPQDDSSPDDHFPVPANDPILTEGYTNQTYRVGCPPLQIRPLAQKPIEDDQPEYSELHLRLPQMRKVLAIHKVDTGDEYGESELVYRTVEGSTPRSEDMTVLVHATWEDDDVATTELQWLLAANAIRKILLAVPELAHVKVEIIAWQMIRACAMKVVEANHPIIAAWPTLHPLVHQLIADSPIHGRWCSVGVMRVGFEDPPPVVLHMTVEWDVRHREFQELEQRLNALFVANGLEDVGVEIERGETNGLELFD